MRAHAFGGQDDVNRRRLFLELRKIHARLVQIVAHGLRENPAGLRVGGRSDAGDFVGLFGEARGEAGNLIAARVFVAILDHVGGGDGEAALWPFALLAVVAGVASPMCPVRSAARGHFRDWRQRRF